MGSALMKYPGSPLLVGGRDDLAYALAGFALRACAALDHHMCHISVQTIFTQFNYLLVRLPSQFGILC